MDPVIYVEAYATSDYGDSPLYGAFALTPALRARLLDLVALCEKHGLTEVREWRACHWGEDDSVHGLRLQADEMIVSGAYFWFKAVPKHCDYTVETRAQSVDAVLGAASTWKPGDPPLTYGEYTPEEWADILGT